MTFGDFKVLTKKLKAVYTSENFIPDENALKMWYGLLGDIPYEVLSIAAQRHIVLNKFPPTIADLRAQAVNVMGESQKDWGEAWGNVMQAVRKYGRYNAQGALESLDEVTREAVQAIGFRTICDSENLSIERANFRQIYETLKERQKEALTIPLSTQEMIKRITDNGMKRLTEVKE